MKIYRLSIYRMVPNSHGYEVFTKDFKTHASAHLSGVVFAEAVVNRQIGLYRDDSRFVPAGPKTYDADEFSVEVKADSFVVAAYKIRIDAVDIATEALYVADFIKIGVA